MDLAVTDREKFGKAVRVLRREGLIPAELYGHGLENAHLAVNRKEFAKALQEAGESTIINLLTSKGKRPALVHDIQKDFLTDEIIHIDFHQVRMDEKIKADVLLEFIGEAPAVKEFGGVLNKTISEIEVEALPGDLPRSFQVDISGLKELNQSIYVKNLKIPKGVEIMVAPETVIITVTPPAVEEEKVEEVAPVDLTAVKVESEEKVAERAKGKEVEEKNSK
ncbi:MAG: 50S ribosomal protein L25 [Candidatus Liptonbacteria bacterium]|nr:50S ribosomal protein L25 [Candidatus Liptonbacteria bacterium]